MKIVGAKSEVLDIEQFEVREAESWCVIGSNRSGIRPFFDLVCGRMDPAEAQVLKLPESIGWVSFKDQQDIYELEVKNDDTDYMDRLDPGTLARDFIVNADEHKALIQKFDMHNCMDLGYRQLSTGQSRKLLILSQIARGHSFLILQAPFEGLDKKSRNELNLALEYLGSGHASLLLFVHNTEDIPMWCSHLAWVKKGRIHIQGELNQVINRVRTGMSKMSPDFKVAFSDVYEPQGASHHPLNRMEKLVHLKNGSAGYAGRTVFSGMDFSVSRGQHTLITGPNGCGKSTLLHVITGDHPACYQNDLTIFNIKRGTGESIWDLKKRMGIVSPELHRNYYIPGPTIHCILSGLFDSIGLYQQISPQQKALSQKWLDRLGMSTKARVPFRDLTFADQRLVLIARALIKTPDLLILDEPTQGLDAANRRALLNFLEKMAQDGRSTIVYVSHREDEFRPFFQQQIDMG